MIITIIINRIIILIIIIIGQQYHNLRFKLGIAIRRKRHAVRIIINAVKEYKERRKAVSVSFNDDNNAI